MKPHVAAYKVYALEDSLLVSFEKGENCYLVKTCHISCNFVIAEQSHPPRLLGLRPGSEW